MFCTNVKDALLPYMLFLKYALEGDSAFCLSWLSKPMLRFVNLEIAFQSAVLLWFTSQSAVWIQCLTLILSLSVASTHLLNTVVKSDHSKWLDTQNHLSEFFYAPYQCWFHLYWCTIFPSYMNVNTTFYVLSWQILPESSSPGISIQPGLLQACDSAPRCSPTITQMKSKCKWREVVSGGQGCPACLSLGDKIVCW